MGDQKTEQCICGKEVTYLYCNCDYYRDLNGFFYYDEKNVCPYCGHIIGQERIENAAYLGSICC